MDALDAQIYRPQAYRIEVLSIGDELLDGRVADTNTLALAQALQKVGLGVAQRTSIPDDVEGIVQAAQAVAQRGAQLCIVSGGLGPTQDDLTAQAMARLLGVALRRDALDAASIAQRFKDRGLPVHSNQLRQSDRPEGSVGIANPVGTALGFECRYQGCRFIALPGVPNEFHAMVEAAVVPSLRGQGTPFLRRSLSCFGLLEAEVDHRLATLASAFPQVRIQYRVKFPEVHVGLLAASEAGPLLQAALEQACVCLGDAVFSVEDASLAQSTVDLLKRKGRAVALAESCTGGLVAHMITEVPGSSEVFNVGVVTYSNEAKIGLVGVRPETLQQHGAVSQAVVEEMAQGAQVLGSCAYGIGISGIAGPGGAAPGKPVGTVWIALVGPRGCQTQKLVLGWGRRGNQRVSAYHALDMLRRDLLEGSS